MRRKVALLIFICFVVMAGITLKLLVFDVIKNDQNEDYAYVLEFTCKKLAREKMSGTYLEFLCKEKNIKMVAMKEKVECPTSTPEVETIYIDNTVYFYEEFVEPEVVEEPKECHCSDELCTTCIF